MNIEKSPASLIIAANQKNKEKSYWLNRLSGYLSKSSFPMDREPDRFTLYEPESIRFSLPEELCGALMTISKGSNERLFVVLMTGVIVLLRKYSGNKDVGLGIPISGAAGNSDFLNTALIIREWVDDTNTFRELLSGVRQNVIEAVDNQNFPVRILPDLLDMHRLSGEGFPLFDVVAALKNIHQDILQEYSPNILITFEQEAGKMSGDFVYNSACYERQTIERLIRHYITIMSEALKNLDQAIGTIEILSPEEKNRILLSFNDTAADFPLNTSVYELIDRQAESFPDKDAIVYKDRRLSYRELKTKTDELASVLKNRGIEPDQVVGVLFDHTPEMVITLLGILKSGAAYIPIAADLPGKRIEYILKDSGARFLVTVEKFLELARESENSVVLYSELTGKNSNECLPYIKDTYDPKHLAYIMYTSGSTGKPKGVMIEHKSFMDFVAWSISVFEHRPSYQVLLANSYASDGSIQQIFPPLASGGTLHLIDKELRLDVINYMDYLKCNRINNVDEVPVLMNELLTHIDPQDESERLPDLTCLCLGSEYVPMDLVRKCRKYLNHRGHIINAYGPAEATVEATFYYYDGASEDEVSLIGKPRSNTRVYILDENEQVCPIGVRGEICISGTGLARGYINKPELTIEKFVPNPYRSIPGDRLYKTGDQGYWLPDGNIRFIGRIDDQVKIRGYRVELSEVEHVLKSFKDINDAVVLSKENKTGQVEIFGYYVNGTKQNTVINTMELREYLESHLAPYMIPSHLIELEKIPLTPNGKVDKNALPDSIEEKGETYIPPRNDIEKELVAIWADVLERDANSIGIHSDFFKIGGHSLKAVTLTSKIQKLMKVEIPFIRIFKTSTIAGLAEYLKEAKKSEYKRIEPTELKEYYPLTSVQKRLFTIQQIEPQSTAYNVPWKMMLKESIEKERLAAVLNEIINRHEILRTTFRVINGEHCQIVHENVRFEVEEANKFDMKPFDLEEGPLFRCVLVNTGKNPYVVVDMHHVICDPVSHEVLSEEFRMMFEGKQLPEPKVQYRDYAEWQNSEEQKDKIKQQEKYWINLFNGELPVLELPTDFPRPQIQSFDGASVDFTIKSEITERLIQLANDKNVTAYQLFMAVFNVFLSKLTGDEDIIVGTPVSIRSNEDTERMIGMFVNTLAIRSYPAKEKTFEQFLAEVKEHIPEAFLNRDYPFNELVDSICTRRDLSRNPIFDAIFNFLSHPGLSLPQGTEETGKIFTHRKGTSKFDLNLTIIEAEDGFLFNIEYCTVLFKPESVERMIEYLKRIASQIIEYPGNKIGEIELISNKEKERILFDFNDTAREYPKNRTIDKLFDDIAERMGNHIAIIGPTHEANIGTECQNDRTYRYSKFTYKQLKEKSNGIAFELIKQGVQKDTIVGIIAERTIETIIGILGILKAGGAYLPVDSELPQERINFMLTDSNAKIVLNPGEIDLCREEKEPPELLKNHSNSTSNLAYVIYTSGSTGKPKGVLVEHGNVIRLVKNTNYTVFTEGARLLQTGALSFDASTFEIWGTLLNGLTLVIAEKDIILVPEKLKEIIKEKEIKIMWMTSALFNQMVNYDPMIFQPLDYLLVGGDVLSPDHIEKVRKEFQELKIINGYGPTENTTFSTAYWIDKEYKGRIPIGKPISNSTAFILDKNHHLQPVGIPGELYLGGDGVARGYLNRPELTTEKFIDLPPDVRTFLKKGSDTSKNFLLNERLYKTGDSARWLENGNIEFLGRIDQQVKIRGFRIELGEIEIELLKHEAVRECAVLADGDQPENRYLTAYLVSDKELEIAALRAYLSNKLPDYMIPLHFIRIENIPLTFNGKVDKTKLPKPEIGKNITGALEPSTEIERKLSEIWAGILGIKTETIGIDDNFFNIGGHSLRAAIMKSEIHKEFNVSMTIGEMFKNPTIREMGQFIAKSTALLYYAIEPVESKEYYPLSFAQKRLYVIQEMDPYSVEYNMPSMLLLEGDGDKDRISWVWSQLVKRHESFRTAFFMVEGEPVQKIYEQVDFRMDYYDTLTSPELSIEELIKNFIRPFDLSKAPLLRVGLIKKNLNQYVMMVDMPHIITDGQSFVLLTSDFVAFYEGKEIEPIRVQYKDFSNWQSGPDMIKEMEKQKTYWMKKFSENAPGLDMLKDYKQETKIAAVGKTANFHVSQDITNSLGTLARSTDTTFYMIFLSILNILIYRYSYKEDIVVGSPITGRNHADLLPIVGMFVNMLALRNRPEGKKTFIDFLGEVKLNVFDAFENQDFQYNELIRNLNSENKLGKNSLFDIVFAMQNIDIPGFKDFSNEKDTRLKVSSYEVEIDSPPRFDLTLFASESGETVNFQFRYSTGAFKEKTIKQWIENFLEIIEQVIRNNSIHLDEIVLSSHLTLASHTTKENDEDFDF